MAYLFIDTSEQMVLGLITDEFKWQDYRAFADKKNSGKIHREIEQMLTAASISIEELCGVIQIAGPGSYTGIRLSEGLVQVLEWAKIPSYSFYHFEIPSYVSAAPYLWYSNAFKSEYFVYSWSAGAATHSLVNEDELKKMVADSAVNCYTHFLTEGPTPLCHSTSELLKNHPEAVFKAVVESRKRVQAFYYRELEQEFKASFF